MDKQHFFIKLIAPRPTFSQDMSDEERQLMQRHIAYWRELTEKKTCILFGPVFDPGGPYGMGVVETENEEEVKKIMNNDPTILSNTNFRFEIFPMRIGLIRT